MEEWGNSIAADPVNYGNVYIAGDTTSPDLDTPGELIIQAQLSGFSDRFVAKIDFAKNPELPCP